MSEFHVEVGAYALDALDETDRAAFEAHLAGCEVCRRELVEFTETATRLGALADEPPPDELRGSVLDAIRAVRPLPPEDVPSPSAPNASDAAPTRPQEPGPQAAGPQEPAPRRALAPSWETAPPESAGPVGPRRSADGSVDIGPDSEPALDDLAARRLSRRSRLLTLAVAAATVIALALGGWTYVLHREQQVAAAQQAAATRLLSAPDVRTYAVTVAGAPATFVVSKSLDEAMFVGAAVPEAQGGRTYQLWTLDADQNPSPDETFAGGPDTRQFMTGDIRDAAYLAVSSEPKGGSKVPTQPVLAVAAL